MTLTEAVKASLYPNPNNGTFTLAYELSKEEIHVKVLITDISGKLVHEGTLDELNNLQTISVNDLQSGIYFVQLLNPDHKLLWTKKVVISK